MGGKSLILILILAAFTSYLAPGDERNLALCLLIDNSGSMDWSGHDPEGLRWEAAKLVIDKTRKGDYICLIDFSDKPFLLQPLTRIDGSPAQKRGIKERSGLILSNRKLTDIDSALKAALDQLKTVPSRITKAVILLTDGEVDVVEVRAGQTVEVSVDALPDRTFHGRVREVALVSALKHGDVTYTVTIELDDVGDAPLRWGMKAFVDIHIGG